MNFTYPIETLKKEIKKLNKSESLKDGGIDGLYHLDKTKQIFEAITLLQKEHLKNPTDS